MLAEYYASNTDADLRVAQAIIHDVLKGMPNTPSPIPVPKHLVRVGGRRTARNAPTLRPRLFAGGRETYQNRA